MRTAARIRAEMGFSVWMDALHRGATVFDGVHRSGSCTISQLSDSGGSCATVHACIFRRLRE